MWTLNEINMELYIIYLLYPEYSTTVIYEHLSITNHVSMSVPSLPGVLAPKEGVREIMVEIAQLLKAPNLNFPGAQPVSFTHSSVNDLLREDFLVCEKSDGLRCLMLLSEFVSAETGSEERVYLITRKKEVSWVQNIHIAASNPRGFHVGTLLDGELILTKDGKVRFLAFDILAHEGKILLDRNLEKRLGYLDELVCKPFVRFCQQEPQAAANFDFKIYMKAMSQSYRLDSVIRQEREHHSDGLIFTSVQAPYICGTNKHILKWKPADENSLDFAIRLDFKELDNGEFDYNSKPKFTLLAWTGPSEQDYGTLSVSDELWEKWKSLNECLNYRIVEVVREDGEYKFMRFRDDKEHGNHINVVKEVEKSIADDIGLEELETYIPQIREKWYERANAKRGVKRKHE